MILLSMSKRQGKISEMAGVQNNDAITHETQA